MNKQVEKAGAELNADISTLSLSHETPDHVISNETNSYLNLMSSLEQMLAAAQPRLLHIAQLNGMESDSADEIVQETLIEAWRHLDRLRSPERFNAWLDGICRNVCKRWMRANTRLMLRETSLPTCEIDELEVKDPELLTFDPSEELNRQDLAALLDRALGYLPASSREALEQCYLLGLSRTEIASRLGLPANALEVRLHRARRQLREVLSGPLRSTALDFGLQVDEESAMGWRETRLWCMLCGRRRLQGVFEPTSDNHITLRMRCPACSPGYSQDMDIVNTGDFLLSGTGHSFRPTFKRAMLLATNFWMQAANQSVCPICKTPVRSPVQIRHSRELMVALPDRLNLILDCPHCGLVGSIASSPFISLPIVQSFIGEYPRWVCEPEALITYAGQSAIRIRFVDVISSTRLTLIVHDKTLQMLVTSHE